ncbi:hypothetical protein [Methanocaldococcus sp.]
MTLEERVDILSKRLLELEKRVDLKIKESEKKLEEKKKDEIKRELLLGAAVYLKVINDLNKNLRVLKVKIIILYILIAILYIINLIILIKVVS